MTDINTEKTNRRVAGKCPMGCGEMLFLGEGGHITCSWVDCPNPSAADKALASGMGMSNKVEVVLRAADKLADRWEKIDGKADDFGRAWELIHYREAREALASAFDTPKESLSIIGREYSLMQALSKLARNEVHKRHPVTDLRKERRGFYFDVQIHDPDYKDTGLIARITLELLPTPSRPMDEIEAYK